MTYRTLINRADRRFRLFKKASNKESMTDFFELTILNVQLIYEKFREIANDHQNNSTVQNWWQTIKTDRDNSEVLTYLTEIRNSVAHGLDYEHFQNSLRQIKLTFKNPLYLPEGGQLSATLDDKGHLQINLTGKGTEQVKLDLEKSNLEFQTTAKKVSTKKAKRVNMEPPTSHFGSYLQNQSVYNLISIALEYYRLKANELEDILPVK